jgi:hypothetical protein
MRYPTYEELPEEIDRAALAEMLDVSPETISRWARAGKFPHAHREITVRIYYTRQEVAAALRLRPSRVHAR